MNRTLQIVAALFCLAVPPASAQGLLFPDHHRHPIPIPPIPRPIPVPGPHPLGVKSLDVETRIQGQVATTRVRQTFINDLNVVVDGTFFYPLPEDATFVEFATWDGDKRLRGEVWEKEEARRRYLSIVRQSWDPGLLEYAGANLFQARVFPVPARGEKRVELVYNQVLRADHGLVGYAYPLQSGTRANPAEIGQVVVKIEIQSPQAIKAVYSPTHTIDVRRDGENRARLSYEAGKLVPDRNFQLYYSLSNAEFGMSLMTYREAADEGYFMILLSPRVDPGTSAVVPKDILFVLDTSGSMQERGKLEKAAAALRFGVRSLNRDDRFNVVAFSTDARKFRDALVPATEEARAAAVSFIEKQTATGGTNIHEALKEALASFGAGDRPRYLVFLTDGLPTVGETDPGRILRDTAGSNSRNARLFTFGVGYDVNTFLLDQLAARNHGTSDYVTPDEDLELKLSNFFAKVASPVMADLALDTAGLDARDIYPRSLPDLFRGSQITVLGRYSGAGRFPVTLRGNVRGERRTLEFGAQEFPGIAGAHDFLPRLWAMRKVATLLEQIRMSGENAEIKDEIIRLAKKYGFVTPYTSYLAMDEKDLTSQVHIAVPMSVLRMNLDAGAGRAAAPAPQEVAASVALRKMKSAEVAPAEAAANRKQVGAKTFRLENGIWTDTLYDAKAGLPEVRLRFGSDELIAALTADPALASYAALGKQVVAVHKGKVYRIG